MTNFRTVLRCVFYIATSVYIGNGISNAAPLPVSMPSDWTAPERDGGPRITIMGWRSISAHVRQAQLL